MNSVALQENYETPICLLLKCTIDSTEKDDHRTIR